MRGIVLDALSEMEVKLRRYLTARLKADATLRQDRLDHFKDRLTRRSKQVGKSAQKMTEEKMLDCFADPLKSDFNTIRQILSSCESDWENLQDNKLLHELQNLRNVFAHESYKWDQQNNCVTVRVEGKECNYRNADFEVIRQKLLVMSKEISARCDSDGRVRVND